MPEGVPSKTEEHMDSAKERASHESLVQLDHSLATVDPNNSVNNGLSASGQPQRNVGNYKQGPAKIRRLPIDGEQYDISFSVISEWDQLIPVVVNRANVHTKYHLQQRLHKTFLAECYLLQDCWLMILNAFIKFIPMLSSIGGNQMIFTFQTFQIHVFLLCTLLHLNIMKTICLGILP